MNTQISPELKKQLKRMIRRVRMIIFARGLVAVSAVLLAVVLAIMAIDATVVFYNHSLRWAFSLSGFVLFALSLRGLLIRPLIRPLSLTRMARVLETRHPLIQERISSAIELARATDSRVSKELVNLLERDAEVDVRGVAPRREFTARSVKPFLGVAAGLALVFSLLFALWPQETWLLFLRALLPHREFDTLQASRLVVEPGDFTMLEGEELRLLVEAPPRQGVRAEVLFVRDKGRNIIERMKKVSSDEAKRAEYELWLPAVSESFEYRVRYGLGLTKPYFIKVVKEPLVKKIKISYAYPAYTGLTSTQVVTTAVEPARAVHGTHLTIEADFNRLCAPLLYVADLPVPAVAGTNAVWLQRMSTNSIGSWSIAIRDSWGFTNSPTRAPWVVAPDSKPRIQLDLPTANRIQAPPHDRIEFFGSANDDFGLAALEVVIQAGREKKELTLPLTVERGGRNWAELKAVPNLAELYDLGFRAFKLFFRAVDNRPPEYGGAQVHESRVINITLQTNAKALREQRREKTKQELHKLLEQAKNNLNKSAQMIAQEKHNFDKENIPEKSQRKLEEARHKVIETEELLRMATEKTEKTPFVEFTEQILDVNDEFVEKAFEKIEEIPQTKRRERRQAAQQAENSLRKAANEINKLMYEELQKQDREQRQRSKLDDLALMERKLAADARQRMDKKNMRRWEQEQNKAEQQMRQAKAAMKDGEFKRALKDLQDARVAMRKAQQEMTPEESQAAEREQKVASESEKAVSQAEDAAQSALRAAQEAQQLARMRQSAEAIQRASEKTKEAARTAEEAARTAREAARQRQSNESDRERIMEQADQAEAVARQASEQAQTAEDVAQAARRTARNDDARTQALAERMRQAAQMAQRAADLARLSARQTQRAEARELPADQEQRSARQAVEQAQAAEKLAAAARQMAELESQRLQEAMRQAQNSAREAATQASELARDAHKSAERAQQMMRNLDLPAQAKAAELARQSGQLSRDASQLARQSLRIARQLAETERAQAMSQASESEEKAREAMELARRARRLAESHKPVLSESQEQAARETENLADVLMRAAEDQRKREALAWARARGRIGGKKVRRSVGEGGSFRSDRRAEVQPDWIRFKGVIESESYEQLYRKTPPEYRDLVKQYFEEISKE